MSKSDMYDNLEMAEGNDLIDEQSRLWFILAGALKDTEQDTQILVDFEELVVELTKRECE